MKKKKEYATWTKRVCKDGYEESYSVEQLDNGYLVSYNKYETKKWETVDQKKYYSPDNPLEDLDIDEESMEKKENAITETLTQALGKYLDKIK